MPNRPSIVITQKESPPARGAPTDVGTWFVAGLSEKGPDDAAILLLSLADYERVYGARVSYGFLYDSLELFFKEGGKRAYVGRVVGPAAVKATRTLNDRDASPDPTLRVDAYGKGTWGNNLSVQVTDGTVTNTYVLVIRLSGVIVEQSPDLANPTQGVAWGATSQYVRITDLASPTAPPSNNPAVLAASNLTGGLDDNGGITDTQWLTALNLFGKTLGPGQVSVPGRTTSGGYTQVQTHAATFNRVAVLDGADTATVATLTSAADAQRTNGRRSSFVVPWVKLPAPTPITAIRSVPPSAMMAGIIARNDVSLTPNDPAAGERGISRAAIDLSQPAWDDTQRDTLNGKGVIVIRSLYNTFRIYGYRSLADPINDPEWINFGNCRLYMGIASKADAIGESYIMRQLDGQFKVINEFGAELKAMLLDYYNQGALFGATPDEAFLVDVGPSINTPTTLANNELRAALAVKMSPFGELVTIEIVKLLITEAV